MRQRTTIANRHSHRSGFTLLEIIAAIFIVSVGLFAVIQLFHFGFGKLHAMNEKEIALRAIQNELETLRSRPFDELANVKDGPFVSETPELTRLINVRATVTIEPYAAETVALKQVGASVVWTGEHGRTIRKELTTLVADTGAGLARDG